MADQDQNKIACELFDELKRVQAQLYEVITERQMIYEALTREHDPATLIKRVTDYVLSKRKEGK